MKRIGWIPEYLRKETGVKEVKLLFARERNYEQLLTELGNGELDLAWLSTIAYVTGKEKYRLRPLVKPVRKNATSYRGIIITRKDSGIKTLADLKGKRMGWVDPESASGYIFPKILLESAGIHEAHDLGETKFLQKHDAVVWNVLLRKVDAGACYDDARTILSNPSHIRQLEVLTKTGTIPNEPIVCRDDLPEELAQRIRAAFLKLDPENPEHQAYLKYDPTDFSRFVPAEDAEYDEVRTMLALPPGK